MLSLTRGKKKLKRHLKGPQKKQRLQKVAKVLSGKGRVRVERSHCGFVHLLNARYVAIVVTILSVPLGGRTFCHHPHSTMSQTCGLERVVWLPFLIWLQVTLDLKADFPPRWTFTGPLSEAKAGGTVATVSFQGEGTYIIFCHCATSNKGHNQHQRVILRPRLSPIPIQTFSMVPQGL